MRSGYRRGLTLALGLTAVLTLAVGVRADGFHTIPRVVTAVDVNTGGEYFAPPVPAGHYAGKDCLNKLSGKANGLLHGGLLHRGIGDGCGTCGGCGGRGCNACGGRGTLCGNGGDGACGEKGCKLFHGGNGGCGNGACASGGCSETKAGCKLFHGHNNGLAGGYVVGNGGGCGLCGGRGCGSCVGHASTIVASGQTVEILPSPLPSGQGVATVMGDPACSDPGCKLFGHHKSKGCGLADPCNSCGGKGCGKCGLLSKLCNSCGGKGCGKCGLLSILCNSCGGKGCGLCGGKGLGNGCGLCGGRGCNACAKARGLVNKLLHKGNIEWFVGPGGPVPLTPGYTPYVVTTRSPRDFFAFPPMTP